MIPNDLIFPNKKQHHTAVFGWEKNISSIGSITFYSSNMLKPYWFSVKKQKLGKSLQFLRKKNHVKSPHVFGFWRVWTWFSPSHPSLPMPFWMVLHFPWSKKNNEIPAEPALGPLFTSQLFLVRHLRGVRSLCGTKNEGKPGENHGNWWNLMDISWKMMEILGKYHVKYDAKWRETWKW